LINISTRSFELPGSALLSRSGLHIQQLWPSQVDTRRRVTFPAEGCNAKFQVLQEGWLTVAVPSHVGMSIRPAAAAKSMACPGPECTSLSESILALLPKTFSFLVLSLLRRSEGLLMKKFASPGRGWRLLLVPNTYNVVRRTIL
jgi:hypothetical protein